MPYAPATALLGASNASLQAAIYSVASLIDHAPPIR